MNYKVIDKETYYRKGVFRHFTEDPIHIGKSSIGWMFIFQAQNEKWSEPPVIWNSFAQIKNWLRKYTVDSHEFVIIDEYDEVISYDEFIDLVESKQRDEQCRSNPDNFAYCRNVDGYRFSDTDFC